MPTLETLFARFQTTGDPASLADVFDRVAPELLRVAHHLSVDLASAEDLVQATFVAAIEHRARYDSTRELLPWLMGILGNQASIARRAARRTPDPARLTTHSSTDPANDAESADTTRTLTDAVEQLPVTYREVVAAHLLDGKRAIEIASELARAPGTVRMQLHRGLDLLRQRLPQGLGALGALLGATRGEAAVRAAVLARAEAATAALAPATILPASLGIAAMTTVKTQAALLVIAVAAAGAWWGSRSPASAPESVPAHVPATLVDEPPPPAAEPARLLPEHVVGTPRTDVSAAPPAAELAAEPEGGWWLVGEVEGLLPEEGEPAVVTAACFDVQAHSVTGRTRADGSFEIDLTSFFVAPGPPHREVVLSVSHRAYVGGDDHFTEPAPTDGRIGERVELRRVLRVEPALQVIGDVRMPAASDPASVEVALFAAADLGESDLEPVATTECDERGSFQMRATHAGEYVVAAAADGLLPSHTRLRVEGPDPTRAPTLELSPGSATIRGRVQLPEALAGRRVLIRASRSELDWWDAHDQWRALSWTGDGFDPLEQRAVADANGRFELSGLRPGGSYHVGIDEVETVSFLSVAQARAVAPAAGLSLGESAWHLVVDVTDGELPLARAEVRFSEDDEGYYSTTTNDDGRKTALLEVRHPFRVTASKAGHATVERTVDATVAGGTTTEVFALEDRRDELTTLVVEPLFPASTSVAMVEATFVRVEGLDEPVEWVHWNPRVFGALRRKAQLTDGVFSFPDLEEGQWRVRIVPGGGDAGDDADGHLLPTDFAVHLPRGQTTRHGLRLEHGGRVKIRVHDDCQREATVQARIVDASGTELRVQFTHRVASESSLITSSSNRTIGLTSPATVSPALAPGSYRLELELEGVVFEPLPFSVRAGEDTTVVVRCRDL